MNQAIQIVFKGTFLELRFFSRISMVLLSISIIFFVLPIVYFYVKKYALEESKYLFLIILAMV